MTKEAWAIVHIIEAIPDERKRQAAFNLVLAFINGTDQMRETLEKAAHPGITTEEIEKLIETTA